MWEGIEGFVEHGICESEMGESGREEIDWLVKPLSDSEMGEFGGKGINILVKLRSKDKVSEGVREGEHRLIEFCTKSEVGKERGERVIGIIKLPATMEEFERGRKEVNGAEKVIAENEMRERLGESC